MEVLSPDKGMIAYAEKMTLAILAAVSLTIPHRVLASCGSATCPLNMSRYLKDGSLSFSVTYEYINQDQIFVGSSRSHVGAIPGPHDEVQTVNRRYIVQSQYGMSDVIGLSLSFPIIDRQHTHLENGEMERFNVVGISDITVSGEYTLLLPSSPFGPALSLILGLKLPTGSTEKTNTRGERAEVTIQPGTGSLDGIIGTNFRQSLFSVPNLSGLYTSVPVIMSVTYQFAGRGADDYRFGNTLLAHLGTEYELVRSLRLMVQVNGRFQGFADVGRTGEPRENTGGTWIFLSPGVSGQFAGGLSGYLHLQIPIYQNVHGIQQTAGSNLQMGVSYTTDLLE
jgi:hypothetical protein